MSPLLAGRFFTTEPPGKPHRATEDPSKVLADSPNPAAGSSSHGLLKAQCSPLCRQRDGGGGQAVMETMQPTPSLTRGRFWLQLHPCTQTPQLTGSDTRVFFFFFNGCVVPHAAAVHPHKAGILGRSAPHLEVTDPPATHAAEEKGRDRPSPLQAKIPF